MWISKIACVNVLNAEMSGARDGTVECRLIKMLKHTPHSIKKIIYACAYLKESENYI